MHRTDLASHNPDLTMTYNAPPSDNMPSVLPTGSLGKPELDRTVIEADYLNPPVPRVHCSGDTLAPAANVTSQAVTQAVETLRTVAPSHSAGCRMWLWQYIACGSVFGATLGVLLAAPHLVGTAVLLTTVTLFIGVSAFRTLVLIAALARSARRTSAATPPLFPDALPTYCVLVPLYREAALVPDLIDALTALDYPRAKLEIVLIVEASDPATCARVRGADLPPYMRFIVVPDRQPRTKPKALNMALALSRGEFVAVFDAEDVPAPNQLRLAAAAFAAAPGRYACLQARLAIHNPRQSWLTRQFALEYATLFHAVLPALVALGLPLPLSGTSNHFPRAVLEDALAWDPFNVTEDADLGIRLCRAGGTIGLLDSATLEEAPATFGQWLPQRTRWIKGWMQTYLVHTRRPWRLLRQLGVWRCFGFHALIAGFLVSALAFPLMVLGIGYELSRPAPFASPPGSVHHAALIVAFAEIAIGVLAALLTGFIGAWRGGLVRLAGNVLAAPLYWLLISAASYRALGQIIRNPYFWEKTAHAPRRPAMAAQRRTTRRPRRP